MRYFQETDLDQLYIPMIKLNMDENHLEISRIEDFIKTLGREELFFINRLVVNRLKLLSQERSTAQMMKFNIGEKVRFEGRYGEIKTGIIFKLNKKTVSIHTEDNEQWNVAPGLLKHSS
ncbi:MAG: hypothetical protein JW874_08045 [Spirochaetales bacterium]|nr:hypothetical protein [Spirochaetales bacterium]